MEQIVFSLEELSFESKLPFITIILVTLITLLLGVWKYRVSPLRRMKLPPGKLGLPIIGESISLLQASKENKITQWFEKRISKYGPIFKPSLMGSNVVVITGQVGNRFVLGGSDNGIGPKLPASSGAILGKNKIFHLSGSRHKLIKGAMMRFLNRESIQIYFSEMDSLIQRELFQVYSVPLMKRITFKVTCSLLFGLPEGNEKNALFDDFKVALRGSWSQNDAVRAREANDGKLCWKEMQKMNYTWNVAQDLMRITLSIFGTFKHACRDTSFGGYDIPKGCGTDLDKKIFEDPAKFDPSRFEMYSTSISPFTYVAFGAGPRICPGAEFARIEVLLIIHHLITTYRWTQVLSDEPVILDPLPYPAKGLPIKIHQKNFQLGASSESMKEEAAGSVPIAK
ncbi:hypothetical protein P3X46_030739 [Hevea brasiliensis]|uniref:Cytochrome P450 n=1 Tax=Hevea brasiliensis TaxID=3981 RepID=A0ABQ9KJC0_HEVBR|nr:hypothetical protein P3X46_030739 [Hevea brasiliensis]